MRFNFELAQAEWLLLIPAMVLFAVLLWRLAAAKRKASLARIVAPRLLEQMLASVNYVRRRQKQVFLLGGLVLLALAIARPMLGNREVRVELPGIDYYIALDVSKSMLAEDVGRTNRITAAKKALSKLLNQPSGDRVGLIAFSGEAFLISPISQDHGAIQRSLMALTTTSVSKPGTDIAAAIKLAVKSFEAKQEAGKAILILSDGEELQGDAILEAREAARQKVAVFTVGVGSTTGARLPDRSAWGQPMKFAKNEFGREILSRLNERVLQQVAGAGRGQYARLDEQGETLLELYENGLKKLPKGTHVRKSTDKQDFFQLPLACALALLLIEMLLSERRRLN